jgi:hypothetical protein
MVGGLMFKNVIGLKAKVSPNSYPLGGEEGSTIEASGL